MLGTGALLPGALGSSTLRVEVGAAGDYAEPAIDLVGAVGHFDCIVAFDDDFVPPVGDVIHVLHAFAGHESLSIELPLLPRDRVWFVEESATDIVLHVVERSASDPNGDGVVDFDDLVALLAAWGPCGSCAPDLDQSGFVDWNDLLILLSEWTDER